VVPAPRPEDQAAALRAAVCKQGVGAAVQGHLTPLAAFRNVEQDDATGAIHALPGQRKHVATMHPAHCHLGLGKLYRRAGKRQEAQEHLTTATTMYREMEMTYWLEQGEAELKD
jgi:hypothetical protein